MQASARMTHFQDDFLGGDHEIGAGVEYQWGMDRYGYARGNPLQWDYYNGNPYYYRGYYGLTAAHPVYGDGRLSFTNCGTTRKATASRTCWMPASAPTSRIPGRSRTG